MPSNNNRGRIHVSQRETNDDVEIIGADLLSDDVYEAQMHTTIKHGIIKVGWLVSPNGI